MQGSNCVSDRCVFMYMNQLHADCKCKLIHAPIYIFYIVLHVFIDVFFWRVFITASYMVLVHLLQQVWVYNSQDKSVLQPAVCSCRRSTCQSHPQGVMDLIDLMISPTDWLTAVDIAGKYLSFETQGRRPSWTCWQAHGRRGGGQGAILSKSSFFIRKDAAWILSPL